MGVRRRMRRYIEDEVLEWNVQGRKSLSGGGGVG